MEIEGEQPGDLSRRDFVKKSAVSAAGLSTGLAPASSRLTNSACSADAERPNVLFLLTDQWRGQALGSAGNPNAKTPHLDEMASQGIRLTHCYANQPVCTPSKGMLMSGRFPTRTGVYANNNMLPVDEYSIGEAFGDAGYSTGFVGKWHLDGDAYPGEVRHTQGWQYFSGFNRGHHYYDGNGVYWEEGEKHRIGKGTYQPADQTNRAMEWIQNQMQDPQPWFMMLSWGAPHTPYRQIPKRYLERFNPDKLTLRKNVQEGDSWSIPHLRKLLQGYYAQINALDENVGRLLDFLRKTGQEENTLVVLTSDHGDMLLSQGLQQHKSVIWEESINIPFIARWPRAIPEGTVSNTLFSTIDMYPTLCGLCDVQVPPGKDGVDYAHVFRQQEEPVRESVYLTLGRDEWRGVRTSRYTYKWDVKAKKPIHLYDNERDPYQMNNLVNEESRAATQRRLHEQMVYWMYAASDPFADEAERAISQ